MTPGRKTPSWTDNIPPPAIRGLDFIRNEPKLFGRGAVDAIRSIVFLDRFPEMKGGTKYLFKGGSGEIRAFLSRDGQTLEIGAPGGIDASRVCERMFMGLDRVERIEFVNGAFHTDRAKSFCRMFMDCRSLKAVNVRGFRTGEAADFSEMFRGCESLTALTVSGFDTSKAYDFADMFSGCKNLQQLDLTNFEIHRAVRYGKYFDERCDAVWFRVPPQISGMFSGCESLTALDLRSFDTSRVKRFDSLFENCKNLETLQLGEWFMICEGSSTDRMTAGCDRLDRSVFTKKR